MKTNSWRITSAVALITCGMGLLSPTAMAAETEPGFTSLFNGQDLTGWDGRPQHWSVQDGAITGRTTKEHPAQGNNFLIWTNGVVGDFELRCSYRITPNNDKGFANSGIQYRSKDFGKFVVGGYQADMEAGDTYSGILYEERMRGILAQRGQKVIIKADPNDPKKPKIEVTGSVGVSAEIQAAIKKDGWNDYVVIAKGNHLQHFINGKQTVDVTDEQESAAAKSGILALQLHAGEPMTVEFKDIRIKQLAANASANSDVDLLQGEWVATEIMANGERVPADALSSAKLKIKGNTYSVTTAEGEDEGTFKLINTTSPKSMNVTAVSGDEMQAIYELSGDTFKTCLAINGAARPKEFKSAEGSDHILTIYKRKP